MALVLLISPDPDISAEIFERCALPRVRAGERRAAEDDRQTQCQQV